MAFLPPINLGNFKPAPATLAQWVYDIWQYLQENPIATQADIATYIQNYFETSPEVQEIVGDVVEQYLLDNPPQAPVQSVQGKTGAVNLTYPDIVPASNAVPVYRAATAPGTSTAQGLYNNGYRLFVNTATQEIYTISNSGALSLVGRGKFDGTMIDVDSNDGDTTIAEALSEKVNYSNSFIVSTFTPLIMNSTGSEAFVHINLPTFDKTKTVHITEAPTNGMFSRFSDDAQTLNLIIDDTWTKTWYGDTLRLSKALSGLSGMPSWSSGVYNVASGQLVIGTV